MAFDAMAATIDWLDAYRAKDLEAIVAMYAPDALIECDCDGPKTIAGEASLRFYWQQRFTKYPAAELVGLDGTGDRLDVAYRTKDGGSVAATIEFNNVGQIVHIHCAPAGAAPACKS